MPNQHTTRPKREIIRPVGPSIAYVPLTRGLFSLIDSSDTELVQAWNWCAVKTSVEGEFAALRNIGVGGKSKQVFLHQAILGDVGCGRTVDHVLPGNPLDNRRVNLRGATSSQQIWNQRVSRRNTSGVKGVTFDGHSWRAKIHARGKCFWLGYFPTKEAAAEAYRSKALEIRGEFARFA